MADFAGLLHHLKERFLEQGVRYALIGGFALHAAGYTRATGDVDILVHHEDIGKVKLVVAAMGYKVIHENENVLNFAAPWQLIGGLDVIAAFRRYTLDMLSCSCPGPDGIPVVSPSGIIGLKVQAMANDPQRRTRDMADIEWLLKTHHDSLDMGLIREYFELFGLTAELEGALKRIQDVK